MKSTPAATVEYSQKYESIQRAAGVDFGDVIRLVGGGVYLCRVIIVTLTQPSISSSGYVIFALK